MNLPHRICATATRTYHPTDSGARSWIYGEEQPCVLDFIVELHPLDTWLHDYVHIVLIQSNNVVHKSEVNTHTAVGCRKICLQ